MKTKPRNELLAGIVILAAVVLFTATFILAGNFSHILQKKRLIRAQFKTARGLIANNPVQVSGVEVGLVKRIYLETVDAPDRHEKEPRVIVEANIPADIYLSKDSHAEIDVSLTGITVLKLERGTSDQPLTETDIIAGSDAINIAELSTKVGAIAASIEQFVNGLTSQGLVQDAREVLVQSRHAATNIAVVSDGLTSFMNTNKDSWNQIIKNFDRLSTELDAMVRDNKANVNKTLANLPQASENIKVLSGDTSQLVKKNAVNITLAISDIQQTADNLNKTSRTVKLKPWILLHKPDKEDVRSRNLSATASDLQDAASEIRNAVNTMKSLESLGKAKSSMDTNEINRLLRELTVSVENFNKLQAKIDREMQDAKGSQ